MFCNLDNLESEFIQSQLKKKENETLEQKLKCVENWDHVSECSVTESSLDPLDFKLDEVIDSTHEDTETLSYEDDSYLTCELNHYVKDAFNITQIQAIRRKRNHEARAMMTDFDSVHVCPMILDSLYAVCFMGNLGLNQRIANSQLTNNDLNLIEERLVQQNLCSYEVEQLFNYIIKDGELAERLKGILRQEIEVNNYSILTEMYVNFILRGTNLTQILKCNNASVLLLQTIESLQKQATSLEDGYYSMQLHHSQGGAFQMNVCPDEMNINHLVPTIMEQSSTLSIFQYSVKDSQYVVQDSYNKSCGIETAKLGSFLKFSNNQKYLQIEYLNEGRYMIVSSCTKENNKERSNLYVIAYNLLNCCYQLVKYDYLQNHLANFCYQFEFTRIKQAIRRDSQVKDNIKLQSSNSLIKILQKVVENIEELSGVYDTFIVLRRYLEFADLNGTKYEKLFMQLFATPGIVRQVTPYYSCSKLYVAAISNGFLQIMFTACPSIFEEFYGFFLKNYESYIHSRHESQVIRAAIYYCDYQLFAGYYDIIIAKYHLFFSTQNSYDIFNSALLKMDTASLTLLQQSVLESFSTNCMCQDVSFAMQKLVKHVRPEFKVWLLTQLCTLEVEVKGMHVDAIQAFMNHRYANYILSAVCECEGESLQVDWLITLIKYKMMNAYELIEQNCRYRGESKIAYFIYNKFVYGNENNIIQNYNIYKQEIYAKSF